MLQWIRTRTTAWMRAGVVASVLLFGVVAPVSAQSDRDQTVPTGWWWLHGVTAAQVQERVDAGFRLVELEVAQASPLRFNAAFVHNSGAYAKGWWWYYGVTGTQLSDLLSQNNARLIDISPYEVSGQTRFAAVMISNTGADANGWWWLWGVETSQIVDLLSSGTPKRIIDLNSYFINGERRYAAVMVANTGSNARAWWWYINASPAFISNALSANNARLTDIEANNTFLSNTFDVVMEQGQGQHWWWYYGVTAEALGDYADQNGARIFNFEKYNTPSGTRFAGLMLNNSNAVTTRVGDILRSGTNGDSGLYLKQVDGPVKASLQAGEVFEPASMIKVLHHIHAMLQVQNNPFVNLGTQMTVFSGYSGSCPQDTGPFTEPLSQTLQFMMQNSDNARTQAVRAFFGENNINNTATSLGLTDTLLQHRLGCGGDALANPNMFTLVDAGRIYEAVADGVLSPANRETFYNLMSRGVPSGVSQIVIEESAAIGLPTHLRNAFLDQMDMARKGGNYGLSTGGPAFYHQTRGGWASIPFRSGGCAIVDREFVLGVFVNNASNDSNAGSAASEAFNELLREEIRAALNQWDDCKVDWDASGDVNSGDFFAFIQDFVTGRADYTGDGPTNSSDFFAFINAFLNA